MAATRRNNIPRLFLSGVLVVVILGSGFGIYKRQALTDWIQLFNYHPSATVSRLADQDTMTARARHVFYVNHPQVTTGSTFTSHCPSGGEKTVVLGCYVGNDNGIYIYDVTDSRLNGVEQVTAAHEMLHAAYRRLPDSERAKVDAMLMDYYEHDLSDARIKVTIDAYKKSEPNDVINEMHSIFGTEVATLPNGLESYYKQYFTNRHAVTNFTAQYQGEFTSRQAQVSAADTQLKLYQNQIDANEAALKQQKTAIDAQSSKLNQQRSGDPGAYDAAIPSYNAAVDAYNSLVSSTKNLINQYNALVQSRNHVVLEEQQLTKAISAQAQPAT